jgi:DNA excision repair protein ERCC-2
VTAPDTESAEPDAWSYAVSVRTLCEFTAKRGDLDRRFTPTATALEGIKGQQVVAGRRGADYEREIPLETRVGPLRIKGRADGYDPRRRTLEEIKTIRGHPDEIPENRRHLHWAQLQSYAALFCRARGLQELAQALVYLDVASQGEVELRELSGAAELDDALTQRCASFLAWARQEAVHRAARDAALRQLAFPMDSYRAGQRDLAERVYRTSATGRCLLAQAPTGIGKTVGTLFPLLRAMPEHGIDKLAFLTCKGTGRQTALNTLRDLRGRGSGQVFRVLEMVAKEQACEYPDKACHGEACPLARGFYDRLALAREEAVAAGWLDAAAQRRIALRHGICPYYLGQELVRWADVLVGDVHHLFDPNGQLWGLLQAHDWRLALLVDEAHNLVERTRQMYSIELPLVRLRDAAALAPASARGALEALHRVVQQLAADALGDVPQAAANAGYRVIEEPPDVLLQALQAAAGALADHFHRQPLAQGALLEFHFELQRCLRLVESLNDHSLLELRESAAEAPGLAEQLAVDAGGAVLAVRNVSPACFLGPRFKALHSATLFSATLAPPDYAVRLLGLPPDTGWIDVPPPFAPEHLVVQVAHGLSTRFVHRDRSLRSLVDLMARQFDAHGGNYLAFFSSFDYLDKAAQRLAQRRPDIEQWRQERRMGAAARQAFLQRFDEQRQGIGFAVLGGVFSEGIDLPGARLIGAFIATLGLPPVSPVQDAVAQRLARLYGPEQGYADLVPSLQKVVQAAGRVIRTPQDRGWVWLMDDRYGRSEVRALLPAWWRI